MATLSSRRKRGDGGPVVETLRETPDLRPSVSPQSIYSYDEKRSDYVERPGYGPNGWAQLGAALAKFNPILDRMVAAKGEQHREEQFKLGQEAMQRNKLAWAEFVKQNPEHTTDNPWFERGYKAAELNSKGQDYSAALHDFYLKNGLVNETDTEKVRQAVSAFSKEWQEQNVPADAYDGKLFADNFLKMAQQAEGNILNRHGSDRAKEHITLAVEKHSQNFAKSIDTIFDNTPNIGKPEVMEQALDQLSTRATEYMAQMELDGMPRSLAHEVIETSIINLAASEGLNGNGREILALADKIHIGSGTLGGKPAFRAKVKSMLESWENERRSRANEARTAWRFNNELQEHNARKTVNNLIFTAMEEGRTPTQDEFLQAVGPDYAYLAKGMHDTYSAMETNSKWTPQAQVEFEAERDRILSGGYDPDAAGLISKYGYDRAKELLRLEDNVREGKDPLTNALTSDAGRAARALMDAQIGAIFNEPFMPQDKEETKVYKAEAYRRFRAEVQVYIDEVSEKKKRPPSPHELELFMSDKATDIARMYQLRKTEMSDKSNKDTLPMAARPGTSEDMATAAYWQKNTVLHFGKDFSPIQKQLESGGKEEVLSGLMNKYGVSRDLAVQILTNQIALYQLKEQESQRSTNDFGSHYPYSPF